ncbi:hypothetical protein M3N64_06625 [Sporolactobacillus sp. CPB3-1]|uniref:Uncharacterized protein n=1 Tax=Sporolactobacillus mangiferae TaxID=2940498 RepID=A0ABT0M9R3_9BACL|nr:hypothetical protein [Sporolactobacillus mangiferae]MCL1631622.1 hypothetical protein [Sporolactobacillus mangiferae]
MAKNKAVKWIVGLSSVVLFSGFIGLAEKFDQADAASSTDQSNSGSQSAQNGQNSDHASTPFFSDDENGSDDQAPGDQAPQDNSNNGGFGAQEDSEQNSQDSNVDGHSS